jgi:hypothetical protein
MHTDRLLKLADILDLVKEDKFDMNRWRSSCGTVACAIGHAAGDEYFRDLGLNLMSTPAFPTGHYSEGFVPEFEGEYNINAAAKLFGIAYSEAEWLFLPHSYTQRYIWKVTPSIVAQRIREFVTQTERAYLSAL